MCCQVPRARVTKGHSLPDGHGHQEVPCVLQGGPTAGQRETSRPDPSDTNAKFRGSPHPLKLEERQKLTENYDSEGENTDTKSAKALTPERLHILGVQPCPGVPG